MVNPSTETVIAGSKAFALALLAPLTERVGTRPRVAADPGQALALCRGGGLVVVEFQGEGSLRAIQTLMVQDPNLRIVAAVPPAHAAAEGPLRALGVDLAPWDGTPAAVLDAVGRRLGAAPVAPPPGAETAPAAPPEPHPPAPERAPPAPSRASVGGLFDDLGPEGDLAAPADAGPGLAAVSSSFVPGEETWPGNAPGALDAAEALARGLAGSFDPPGSPFAPVAEVVGTLTELERSVLGGAPQPIDTEPIRRAAVMRVRVAAALAMRPAAGGPVDSAAVSAWLAEIDALLAKVNALAQATPPELQPAVEQVRNSLVKEAIDFSEAAQGGPADGAPAARPAGSAPTHLAERTRIVSVDSKAETELAQVEQRRRVKLVVLLAVVVAAIVGVNGWQWWSRRPRVEDERVRRVGAPLDSEAVEGRPGTPIVIRSKGGRPFTAEELRRIDEAEGLKGNRIIELGPGRVMVVRAGSRAPAPASAPPAPAGAPAIPASAPPPAAAPPTPAAVPPR